MTELSITYAWPDYRLSPNGRTNRRNQARLTKEIRRKAAEETDARGLNPARRANPTHVVYHPPSARWDRDNCRAMSKAILDGIADAMAVNDRTFDPKLRVAEPVKGGAVVVIFEIPPD